MKRFNWTLVLVLTIFTACRNYETDRYYQEEYKAIQDLLPHLLELDKILQDHNSVSIKPVIILNSELHNEIMLGPEYEVNNKIIAKGEPILTERVKSDIHKEEKRKFKPLLNGKLKTRKLTTDITVPKVQVKSVSIGEMEPYYMSNLLKEDSNVIGFLGISRAIFNRSFDTGYLSYTFFGGAGCIWSNNIEIVKRKGNWDIARTFSY